MGRVTETKRIRTVRVRDGRLYAGRKGDHVAVEEPLDIRLNGQQLSLTMRTPGSDVELIHGFLHGEGIIASREDIVEARYCDGAVVDDGSGFAQNTYNVMDFTTARPQLQQVPTKRFTTTSACGVCGSESIDAVRQKGRYVLMGSWTVDPRAILDAARNLTDDQAVFSRTGGVHAAALVTRDGEVLVVREDVGRHNAVDKVIGWALLEDRLPLNDCFLLVSSRASFEIAQKAFMAGIPLLACVSAASSLAIDTAQEVGMTLVGFTRAFDDGDGRMNVYTHPERLDLTDAEG
ncbi:formate dehydrogenase accessory sulfurtransferase FdhD [Brachybacterium sp. p3-SID1565]|uniref:Sulfur carrier protein FdhD n=1 Tax=Brachybacterium epidermidis TaxID=2781983 RepID=A0ABR9W2N0_9MICO|nr:MULTISPECIES: formate dehydrogenase accessory sulfurtransferase FdhD [Brachybacterium]MBE9404702.1 formate dehydrogenase accessory sulfurtransferase FdhD [Brachybacterium epidermidis]MCT1385409.1 formate dehydrogenase accessory sulfurtransferase FdhD [Brachybacterium sp. p3-SID1565]